MLQFWLGSVRICLTVPFFGVVALCLCLPEALFLQWSVMACFLHEMGHLAMLHFFHHHLTGITFYGAGIRMETETAVYSFREELWILLAGPLCNLLTAGLLFFLTEYHTAAMVQCVIGGMNLLPFRTLDGGAALQAFFYEKDIHADWRTFFCVAAAVAGILWGMGAGIHNVTYYGFLGYLILAEYL